MDREILLIMNITDLSREINQYLPALMARYQIYERDSGLLFDWILSKAFQRTMRVLFNNQVVNYHDLISPQMLGWELIYDELSSLFPYSNEHYLEAALRKMVIHYGLHLKPTDEVKAMNNRTTLIVSVRTNYGGL